jgi:hypothetical protein
MKATEFNKLVNEETCRNNEEEAEQEIRAIYVDLKKVPHRLPVNLSEGRARSVEALSKKGRDLLNNKLKADGWYMTFHPSEWDGGMADSPPTLSLNIKEN